MKAFTLSLCGLALAGWLVAGTTQACEGHGQSASVKKVSVEQVAALLNQKGATVAIYDANGDETRAKFGVIPGAHLLSSYATFDPSKELPANKGEALVFYCGSEKCTAAPKAAERAVQAGYTDVSILDAGIKGWVGAGKEVVHPSA